MKQELSVLKRYCDALNWSCEEKSESVLSAEVVGEEGERKTLWIVSTTDVVEMSVQSGFLRRRGRRLSGSHLDDDAEPQQ